ncbi:MAG: Ig-like domain-containing protein, partial [Actinomycetota bacterium]
MLVPSVARAVNEPRFISAQPQANSSVQSSAASVISATFDRDLSSSGSGFTVRDNTNALVAGTHNLSGPQSPTVGRRALSFYPSSPLDESLSPYTATVTACPEAGGCTTAVFSFAIDDTPPAAPVVTSPGTNEIRNEQAVVARGFAEAGAQIVIRDGDTVVGSTTTSTSGGWITQLSYPSEDGVQHTLSVFAIDRASNWSAPASRTFVHDSVVRPPAISLPAQNAYVSSSLVHVTGTAKPATTVTLSEGTTPLASTSAASDGTWTCDVAFSQGTHVITASSTDEWGTVDGPSEARTFTVDSLAPATPVITAPAPGAVVATSNVAISGTAEPGSTVQIHEGSGARGATTTDGAGSWTITIGFTDGAHTINAEATDAAGDTSGQVARTFTVDTVAPQPPRIDTPLQHSFLNSPSVTVSGGAEPNATVFLSDAGAPIATTTADGSGSWSVVQTFADGTHSVTAIAQDAAGNTGPASAARTFTVDTVAPSAPSIITPANGSTITTTHAVTVSGVADGAVTVRVIESSTTIGTVVSNSDGNWAVLLSFANGVHTMTATATDLANNTGPSSVPVTFTVNVPPLPPPPAAPVITDPPEGSLQRPDVI